MAKQQKKQETNNNANNSAKVCSKHGAAHEYNVQCRKDPEWTSMYQYRQVCGCGDVLSDWHQ